jgi:hypothetical protein
VDRPLAGERFDTVEEFGKHLREYSEGDLARRADAGFTADLGAFMALLSVVGQFPALIATGRLDTRSQVSDMDGWWFGFFSYFASGPPPRRLEELLTLHEVGVVSFLGAEMRVDVDNERGLFVGSSTSYPGAVEASRWSRPGCRLPACDGLRTSCCARCVTRGPGRGNDGRCAFG